MQRMLLKRYAEKSGILINTLRNIISKQSPVWAEKIGKCWYIDAEIADLYFKFGKPTMPKIVEDSKGWFEKARRNAKNAV